MVKRDYQGQIDYFAVFCPETRKSYLVPITDVTTKHSAVLRVHPPRNCQRAGIRFAAAYEIGPST
jgi:PD-(D/E)XK endonuclease